MHLNSYVALLISTIACTALSPQHSAAGMIVDEWSFTLQQPAADWHKPEFDDNSWQLAQGGFGSIGTPGARIGTTWNTKDIWLRKSFAIEKIPAKPALLVHHDEDATIHINGREVLQLKGYLTDYKLIPLPEEHRAFLKEGQNLLAVHCAQTTGGQFIDVHLVNADSVPALPPPERKPFISELITPWGEKVTESNAWREYPRPQMQRKEWQNLNGHWDYAITPVGVQEAPQKWNGKILIPYCLESKLGGVQKLLQSGEALWYRRDFNLTPSDTTLLNFEAVDYSCKIFVNGKLAGEHKGGNTPFSLDISDAVKSGSNELLVRVEDDQEAFQLHGKQTLNPRGIWYTQVSGIWQTVWLEQVNQSYINDLVIHTDAGSGTISVTPQIKGSAQSVNLVIKDQGKTVAAASGSGNQAIEVKIASAKLWSPTSPSLYTLELTLKDKTGKVLDQVDSYAGIRTIGKKKDANGNLRFTLNGKEIFHWGPLDQGWWPDGLLTPPSDEAMIFEIEWLKKAGFNMIRKHIKVEPRRYYYHCDQIGMMMWQDQVSANISKGPKWTFLNPNPKDAEWPAEHHAQFMLELERMIANLENHPCIVCWVPFNEAWGQHNTVEVGKWTVARDPSRHVSIASGGNFWPVGDIVSAHSYPHPGFPFDLDQGGRFDGFIKVVGEFGGHGYPVKDHLWDPSRRNWGYGGLPENEAEYRERFNTSIKMLNDLRGKGIAGAVYTQTTDVEGEINGLISYDRKVIKIPAEELARISAVLFE